MKPPVPGRLPAASLLLLAAFVLAASPCRAQPDRAQALLESDDGPVRYALVLSGTVGTQTIQGARAILTLSFPVAADSPNPYQIVVVGFPAANSRDTFYWNSEGCSMDALAGAIRCRMTNRTTRPPDNHFFYLSPALFARQGALTQREGERIRQTEQTAQPLQVFARDGEMTLNATKDRVAGRVVMTGFDPATSEVVRYAVSFEGRQSQGLRTKP